MSAAPNRQAPLKHFSKTRKLFEFLLEMSSEDEMVAVTSSSAGGESQIGLMDPSDSIEEIREPLTAFCNVIESSLNIACKSGVPSECNVTFAELDEQSRGIGAISSLIEGAELDWKHTVAAPTDALSLEEQYAVPIPVLISYGEWAVIAALSPIGSFVVEEEELGPTDYDRLYALKGEVCHLPILEAVPKGEKSPSPREVREIAADEITARHPETEVLLVHSDEWMVLK